MKISHLLSNHLWFHCFIYLQVIGSTLFALYSLNSEYDTALTKIFTEIFQM